MKILHVITGMDPKEGGVCQAVRNIADALSRVGGYSEVASLDTPDAKFIADDALTIHPLGSSKSSWRYSGKLAIWLEHNLNRFDTVIVHGLWLYPSFAVNRVMKKLVRKHCTQVFPKLFIMPHGMLDPYFQKAAGRKLKAIRNWLYWKLIENEVISNADGLLFTCITEMELARKSFQPYLPKKEIVVGLGVQDPPEEKASMREAFLEKCPELENNPYLLFLSRIDEKKGVDLLLRAFALIGNRYLKNNENSKSIDGDIQEYCFRRGRLRLVIAGPGLKTPYGQKIQQMIDSSKFLKSNVYLTGMLQGDAKWGAFYGCEAFVLPSYQENFGIAVVEALACKKPVLISNEINIWKEIQDNGGGVIKDATLKGTIELLNYWTELSQPQKETMGKKAGEAFKKYFAIAPASSRFRNALHFSEY